MRSFLHGLSERLKDELAVHDVADSLDMVINLAIKLDNRIRERRRERNDPVHSSGSVHATPFFVRPSSGFSNTHDPNPCSSMQPEEPMQVGRASISQSERQRRIRAGECIYYARIGHFLAACPLRPKDRAHQ